jgi:hypothetical protein
MKKETRKAIEKLANQVKAAADRGHANKTTTRQPKPEPKKYSQAFQTALAAATGDYKKHLN